ncbi:MAG: pyridine nucleotide-disulfide oxidoreductase [Candidatus Eisenbacteria bacterium]|uniref:Pyridine nucleotide-disulfide oxidoreductase n=1 Tax=Eiseniibacteriota bacterium TaxID=2212470 RepID=A0A538U9Z6_UNCEI|nr:MAG: pyridine nucleotide-disulfide oxidoreductase [Candidatus Eisenbacteria bacterium]
MSRCLTARSIDHVILERGEVANSWKRERWDSLRLLTPNWLSRLPGYLYQGDDPDGFRTMPETIDFIERYAAAVSAPVRTHTDVTSVRAADDGYQVSTTQGDWRCRAVVLATGACNVPCVPPVAAALPAAIRTLTAMDYRNPGQLEPGGVLVVGASASGTQIADEIHGSGRPVTLAAGEHIRTPRTYRGRDIKWWMDAAGVLDDRYDEVDDIDRARSVPSLQLAGSTDRRTVDLNRLSDLGVRLVGRLVGVVDGKAQFSGSLRNHCAMSDLKMNRLLERIDAWATEHGVDGAVDPPHRFEPTRVESSPPLGLDLRAGEIRTVVWASGFRPDYSWLDVPVLDHKERIRHDGGVATAPGLYVLGLPFLLRRKSSLIDGAAADASDLSDHLVRCLDHHTVPGGNT